MRRQMLWTIAGGVVLVGLGFGAAQLLHAWQGPARLTFDNQSPVAVTSIVFTGMAGGVAAGQQVAIDYRPPVPAGQMTGEASVGVQLVFADGSTASASDIYVENASRVTVGIGADKSVTLR